MALAFYLDEDSCDAALVHALARLGLNVTVPLDAGLLRGADNEQLRYAASIGRVLVSGNVGHFHALHTEWLTSGLSHAGIVLVAQQRFSIGERARRLALMSERLSPEDMVDRLEFLSDWR